MWDLGRLPEGQERPKLDRNAVDYAQSVRNQWAKRRFLILGGAVEVEVVPRDRCAVVLCRQVARFTRQDDTYDTRRDGGCGLVGRMAT